VNCSHLFVNSLFDDFDLKDIKGFPDASKSTAAAARNHLKHQLDMQQTYQRQLTKRLPLPKTEIPRSASEVNMAGLHRGSITKRSVEKMPTNTLLKQNIICCCGSGGVGKTTLSAALAFGAARSGRRSIVLTIDPAKRLATAMGIDSIDHTPRVVATNEFKHLKLPKGASLSAMMLDTKRTFDRIIERYAIDNAARERILTNPLYKHLSTMIAGSQEYMAMEIAL
jgi:Mrp family chromosome partitioning ATPase